MAKRAPNVHVVPNPTGSGWIAKQGGEVISRHRTQAAAIDSAGVEARRDGVERVIHRTNGVIREKDSFGNDPFPPRG